MIDVKTQHIYLQLLAAIAGVEYTIRKEENCYIGKFGIYSTDEKMFQPRTEEEAIKAVYEVITETIKDNWS